MARKRETHLEGREEEAKEEDSGHPVERKGGWVGEKDQRLWVFIVRAAGRAGDQEKEGRREAGAGTL